ncbi:MAG TPA: homocysteine S-methyltransferase family protein [Polyangiaceae bacterium]|nr:homocysteine S-methyltransferase family protein [Polyangiaceae bacterium]
MSFEHIRDRLQQGRPLILDADMGASLRARGVKLDVPGTLGQMLREQPHEVFQHHLREVECRVDVISALTADTTPRALSEVGMQHRAAQLTSRAVDLALDATQLAHKPVAVASVLGSDMVAPTIAERLAEELTEHAARLRVAGSELIIARGLGSRRSLMAALTASRQTELPTWAVWECDGSEEDASPEALKELLSELSAACASVVLFEVRSVETGVETLRRARVACERLNLVPGILLAASNDSVRGFDDPTSEPEHWAERALELCDAGARVLGGGAGTTESHTRALAFALGSLHPSGAPCATEVTLCGDRGGC